MPTAKKRRSLRNPRRAKSLQKLRQRGAKKLSRCLQHSRAEMWRMVYLTADLMPTTKKRSLRPKLNPWDCLTASKESNSARMPVSSSTSRAAASGMSSPKFERPVGSFHRSWRNRISNWRSPASEALCSPLSASFSATFFLQTLSAGGFGD
jgi:hypothetical protein